MVVDLGELFTSLQCDHALPLDSSRCMGKHKSGCMWLGVHNLHKLSMQFDE